MPRKLARFAVSRRRDDQSGAVTPFVLIVTIALFMLAGLVIDGGRYLSSKSRALAYAQESARAGVQGINLEAETAQLDKDVALEAASRFCQQAMSQDDQLIECEASVHVTDDVSEVPVATVRVNTKVETDAILSGMIGIDTWTASGTAGARPVQGITEAQTGQKYTIPPPDSPPPKGNPFGTDGPGEPPTASLEPCPKGYDDPYHPGNTWEPGDKPLKPPINDLKPTEPVPCWPPWTDYPSPPDNDGPGNGGPNNDGPNNDGPNNDGPGNGGPNNGGPNNDGPNNDGPNNDNEGRRR